MNGIDLVQGSSEGLERQLSRLVSQFDQLVLIDPKNVVFLPSLLVPDQVLLKGLEHRECLARHPKLALFEQAPERGLLFGALHLLLVSSVQNVLDSRENSGRMPALGHLRLLEEVISLLLLHAVHDWDLDQVLHFAFELRELFDPGREFGAAQLAVLEFVFSSAVVVGEVVQGASKRILDHFLLPENEQFLLQLERFCERALVLPTALPRPSLLLFVFLVPVGIVLLLVPGKGASKTHYEILGED